MLELASWCAFSPDSASAPGVSVTPLGVSRRARPSLQNADFPADGLESLLTAEPRPALRLQPTRCFLSLLCRGGFRLAYPRPQ